MGDDIEICVQNVQQSTAAHNQLESYSYNKDDAQMEIEKTKNNE